MLTYKGGSRVGKGTYWNLREGMRVDVAREDVLPGNGGATYLRMSPAVMLLSGPFVGLAYAIFLPIMGIITVVSVAVGGVVKGMYNLAAKTVSFGWRPENAYLSGKKKKKKQADK